MGIIKIDITDDKGVITASCNQLTRTITQYDHMAQTLDITRSPALNDYDLSLLFDGYGPITIGTANTYTIPNALTQNTLLALQVALRRGDEYREGANKLLFQLRTGIDGSGPPVEPLSDDLSELSSHAHFGEIGKRGNYADFRNMVGDVIDSLYIGGGGGIIPGGDTGQVLAKASDDDGDVEWVDPQSGPQGPPGNDGGASMPIIVLTQDAYDNLAANEGLADDTLYFTTGAAI